MLRFRHNVKVFLVDGLILSAGVNPLDPGVVPVRIDFLTGHIDLAVFQSEQRTVLAETHV